MAFSIFAISAAAISIIFGVLVLMFPKFLRYLVGGYFIIMGLLKLL